MEVSKAPQSQESKLHFLDYWRIIRIRKAVILAVFLLVVITTAIITQFQPESYSSLARMKVEKDTPLTQLMMGSGPMTPAFDQYFLQTEFQVIRSPKILNEVIKSLKLARVYAERDKQPGELPIQDAYETLSREVDITQFRNTAIIEITAFNEDLTNKLAGYEKEVSEAREKMDKLRIDLKEPEEIADSGQVQGLSAQELSRMTGVIQDYQTRITRNNRLLEQLGLLKGDRLLNALVVANPTTELNTLISARNYALRQASGLSPDFGPDHPEVIKWSLQIAKLDEQLDATVQGILSGMRSTLEAEKAAMENQKTYLQETIEKNSQDTQRFRPYIVQRNEFESARRIRDGIKIRVAQEDIDRDLSSTSSVETINEALPGTNPVRPKKAVNITIGVVFGLILGIGLAFFIEYLDTSVKTIDDVEQALQAPVLGVIPQNVGALMSEGADSPHAEAYRVLRTNILFSRKDTNWRTMTVVSGGAGEGKSTTIFNLATVFAQNGNRVLIVDSDLRRPSLHKILNVANNLGLTNYLLKQNRLDEVIQTTPVPSLDFMPSGRLPSSSIGILNSAAMKEFIAEAKSRYDFVFFDSPPIMGVSDASILASEVDMAVLVVQYRKYPQQMTLRAKQMVEKVGGHLLGVVLNNINISQDSYYYYYSGYYYDYYSKSEDSKPDGERKLSKKKKADAKPAEVLVVGSESKASEIKPGKETKY
ncbi:MAG: polysaccharide biosynthesis tyrosine autokinase [Verrucomicrobia bacterium]|nr:polysaccharide biosynthesis tyrosine autokinase [Verrucomicrobiota bacterium]